MVLPAKRPVATVVAQPMIRPPAVTRKESGQKTGDITGSLRRAALSQVLATGATGETTAGTAAAHVAAEGPSIPRPVETQGSNSFIQTQPVPLPSLEGTNTPSGTATPASNPPGPVRDVAFALRLTWQPPVINPVINNDAMTSFDPRKSIDVASRTGQLAGLSEVASREDLADAVKAEIPTPVPVPSHVPGEPQSSRANDPPPDSNFSLLPSIPARPPGPDSTVPAGTGLLYPAALERVLHWDGKPGSATPAPGLAMEAVSNPAESAAPLEGATNDPVPVLRKISASPSPGATSPDATSPDTPAPDSGTRAAGASQDRSQEQIRVPESAATPLALVAPSGSTARIQATSPNYSGNMTGRDTADSESDRKAPRIPSAEKAPQIDSSNQRSGQCAAGVWLDRVMEQRGVMQPAKILAPEKPPPATNPPESETTSAVQTPAIREISFRLAAASANVDIQVVQRAGKVQVAVRTADPELANSLQTNLGELVGRLEDKGFRTEAWTPVTAQHGSGAVREPSNSPNSQSQSDHAGNQSGQRDPRQPQQESNQRQQGRWKTQLEETLAAPIATTPAEETL